VVYDTLLRNPFDEVRLVVAHELGHRKAGHVVKGTVVGAVAAAAGVLVLWLITRSAGLLRASDAQGAADPRLLPLLLLAVTVIGLVTQPPGNWMSRRFEEEADRFALALTADREVYVRAERGLALRNLSDLDPGPVAYRFLYTHPPAPERISYAD
jgi:STE24 endopeptidase